MGGKTAYNISDLQRWVLQCTVDFRHLLFRTMPALCNIKHQWILFTICSLYLSYKSQWDLYIRHDCDCLVILSHISSEKTYCKYSISPNLTSLFRLPNVFFYYTHTEQRLTVFQLIQKFAMALLYWIMVGFSFLVPVIKNCDRIF